MQDCCPKIRLFRALSPWGEGLVEGVIKQKQDAIIPIVKQDQYISIGTDWSGRSGCGPSFHVSTEGDDWAFRVRVAGKPLMHPDATPGAYLEGLWRYDVAEWFIANPDSGRYLEWNLAPGGAWWMMVFDAPRQRARNQPDLAGVSTEAATRGNRWQAGLCFPRSLIASTLGAGVFTHNVCFILGSPRQYFSWVDLPADEPDFHLPQSFRRLETG